MDKPKEFWITVLENIYENKKYIKTFESELEADRHCFCYLTEGVASYHVIEKSAYDKVLRKIKRLEKRLKK